MAGREGLGVWLRVLLALSCLVAGSLSIQHHHFYTAEDLGGALITTQSLFHRARTSKLNCARLCSEQTWCYIFTFLGDRLGSCRGYPRSALESQPSTDTVAKGTKIYFISGRTPKNCEELLDSGQLEGVIDLWTDQSTYFGPPSVVGPGCILCGGVQVFQRRQDGSVDFYRGWADYRTGFGDVRGEHWLGLEVIRQLTSQGSWDLKVYMRDREGNSGHAIYSNFWLGSEDSFYPLLYHSYSGGNAGDSLSLHRGLPFSTKDRDHDRYGDSCAIRFHGAWWYNNCLNSNLNGQYNSNVGGMGVNWLYWRGIDYSLPFTQMQMRRV